MKHTPAKIIDAAVAAIDERGVGVSMAQIAAAAGVSNGTLFHYFPTKQSVIDSTYIALKAELSAAAIPNPPSSGAEPVDELRELWIRWIAWARANPERHRVVQILRNANLVSPDTLTQGNDAFAGPLAAMHRAESQGLLVDLPVVHLGQLLIAQLEFTITSDLPESDLTKAFDLAWRSVTRPTTDPAPSVQEKS